MTADKKAKISTSLMINVAFGVMVFLALAYLGVQWRATYSLNSAVENKKRELLQYQTKGISVLNREKLKLENQLKEMSASYEEIVDLLVSKSKSTMPKDPGDPLKFKEELYKTQTDLHEAGAMINFQFPPDLGFEKYQQEVPTASDLPIRVEQLEIIKHITGLMLKSNIAEIADIEFDQIKDITFTNGNDVIYKEFPVKITFKAKNESLIGLMYGLSVSDIIYKVDYLNFRSTVVDGGLKGDIDVTMTITAAIFP